MRNTIIHLIGYPGVGKHSIAQEIASLVDVRLIDNHLVANPIFALMARNSPEPISREVWARIGIIRDLMLLTMEDISPPDLNFVLTNVIMDEPGDVAVFERVLRMVAVRNATYVPVVLDCVIDEHLMRIPTPERAARFKWTDVAAVQASMARFKLLRPDHPNLLQPDVTALSPADAARAIVAHTEAC